MSNSYTQVLTAVSPQRLWHNMRALDSPIVL